MLTWPRGISGVSDNTLWRTCNWKNCPIYMKSCSTWLLSVNIIMLVMPMIEWGGSCKIISQQLQARWLYTLFQELRCRPMRETEAREGEGLYIIFQELWPTREARKGGRTNDLKHFPVQSTTNVSISAKLFITVFEIIQKQSNIPRRLFPRRPQTQTHTHTQYLFITRKYKHPSFFHGL